MRARRLFYVPMASLVLAIGFSQPAVAQQGDNQLIMNLVVQIQQLQDEVRMLRGQIEEQAFQIESLQQRQRDQYLDLDQRLNELRSGGMASGDIPPTVSPSDPSALAGEFPARPGTSSGDGASAAAAAASAAGVNGPAVDDGPEVRAPLTTESAVTGLATPQVEARAAPASPEEEKAAYDAAFQDLKDLRYAAAADGFQDFLQRYPGSEYADNAQYWLGESYYVTRNYEIALEAFRGLLDRFPESAKAPDALLKIGYTHYELKQWDQARAALTQVQEQYPDTTLARLASSRLRSMRLEGHF